MFPILKKELLAQNIVRITLEAPVIAAKARAGQFVAVVIDTQGERIPLTIADWDKDSGTITLIFQKIGYTTRKLSALNAGDSVSHILGPLGHPSEIKSVGTAICIGGGVGIAEVYPVARAFKEAGNRVIGIIGARAKEFLILEGEMRSICDELFVTTDDGSYARKGLVTAALKEILDLNTPHLVYAIGPVPMMQGVSELTKPHNIKTIVSLNPVMVDATGMCGSCRCTVAGKIAFGCVDGPDFDGHQVDFEELKRRLKLSEEQEALIDKTKKI